MSPTLERRLSRSTQGTSSSVALRWSAGDSMSSTPPSLPPSLTQSAQSWRVLAPGASAVPRLEVAQERAPRTSRLQPLPSLPDEAIEAKALQPPAPMPNTARRGCGQTRLSSRQDGGSLQRSGSEMLRAPTLRLSLRNSQKALQQTLLEIRQLNQQKRHIQKELEHRQLSTTSPLRQQEVQKLLDKRRSLEEALNWKLHEEVSARGRVDDLQRELKLETSDAMQDPLQSGPTTPKGSATARASNTSSMSALPGRRSPSADTSFGVEALPPNPSQVRQLAKDNAATLDRLRAENARLRNLCAERGLEGDGSPSSPRRARSRPKGSEAQPLRSLLAQRPAGPPIFATPRSQDGLCAKPGLPTGVFPAPVRFITPTPRATSPATAPSMPVPAFYAAPARNMPGYPSFGGLSVSL